MLKLQHAPTFRAAVDIPLAGDKVAHVDCEFRWMHAADLADFLQRVQLALTLDRRAVRVSQFVVRLLGRIPGLKAWAAKRTIPYRDDFDCLSEILVGWDGVDMPWSREACERLVKMYPQAVSLILGAWAKALGENRLGN